MDLIREEEMDVQTIVSPHLFRSNHTHGGSSFYATIMLMALIITALQDVHKNIALDIRLDILSKTTR